MLHIFRTAAALGAGTGEPQLTQARIAFRLNPQPEQQPPQRDVEQPPPLEA